jgi:hypothetical protein
MMRLSRGGGGWIEVEIELNGSVEVEFFLFIKSYYYSTRMHACVGGIEDNAPVHLPCVGCCCGSHRNRLGKQKPSHCGKPASLSPSTNFVLGRVRSKAENQKGRKTKGKSKVVQQSEQMYTARSASIPSIHSIQVVLARREITSSLTRASNCTRLPSCTCPPGSTCTSWSCTKDCRRPGAFSPRRSHFHRFAGATAVAGAGRERHRKL